MGLAHWDDVEQHHRAKGEMDATWQRLGVIGRIEILDYDDGEPED